MTAPVVPLFRNRPDHLIVGRPGLVEWALTWVVDLLTIRRHRKCHLCGYEAVHHIDGYAWCDSCHKWVSK
jgi:hypothetical protein